MTDILCIIWIVITFFLIAIVNIALFLSYIEQYHRAPSSEQVMEDLFRSFLLCWMWPIIIFVGPIIIIKYGLDKGYNNLAQKFVDWYLKDKESK